MFGPETYRSGHARQVAPGLDSISGTEDNSRPHAPKVPGVGYGRAQVALAGSCRSSTWIPAGAAARAAPGAGALLGGLLGGGAAGGILSGGLGDLLKQFQQNGQGDKAQSWISSGPNKAVSPRELEEALGPDKIAWLMQQTGQRRGSSRPEFPNACSPLPAGGLPTEQEAGGG